MINDSSCEANHRLLKEAHEKLIAPRIWAKQGDSINLLYLLHAGPSDWQQHAGFYAILIIANAKYCLCLISILSIANTVVYWHSILRLKPCFFSPNMLICLFIIIFSTIMRFPLTGVRQYFSHVAYSTKTYGTAQQRLLLGMRRILGFVLCKSGPS